MMMTGWKKSLILCDKNVFHFFYMKFLEQREGGAAEWLHKQGGRKGVTQ